jgi:coiled-coil domain-containing protein 12
MALAEASDARKARLTALRKKKTGEEDDIRLASESIIKNRNFDPESRTLRKRTHADDVVMQGTVEKDVMGMAEKIIAEDEQKRSQELDVFNIAPKRPNWDLKREMEKKLSKLDRKTQEAIHTLIRQRLATQQGESDDIVGAMRAQEKAYRDAEPLSDEED